MPAPKPPLAMFSSFYGVADKPAFMAGRQAMIDAMKAPQGIFAGDNLMVFDRTLSFLQDEAFMQAYARHAVQPTEKATLWRLVTLVWAARQASRLEGDFVECACYRGTTARIITDVLGLAGAERRYFLYDLFDHDPDMPHHSMPDHSRKLFEEVKARFSDAPNVVVTQGRVPDSFAQAAPETVAFMHIDLNNVDAEIGALEVLFDRLVPGGVVVLDDFGWLAYSAQNKAEHQWFGDKGYRVLEMPTGQGLVIK